MAKKEAKYTETLSVLLTGETDLRLNIIAARKKMSRSDLVRRVLDDYVAENIEEIPTKQVVTANIKYTLQEMQKKLLARADESDGKAVNRERSILQKLLGALTGIKGELQQIHYMLQLLPEMKASLDEFLTLWYGVRDDQANK